MSPTPTEQREQLRSKLAAENRPDLAALLDKCGQPLRLRCPDCQSVRDVFTRCDNKWCPSCQRALAARAGARYAAIAEALQWPLFVTFTCRHSASDGPDLLRLVRRAHTKLRRLRWWKRAVTGGIIAFEVARGDADDGVWGDNGWHPHGHALLDCRWLSVATTQPGRGATKEQWAKKARAACAEVAEQWSLCLGRKGTVHVRRCWTDNSGGIGGAVAEVLKYSVKGSDLLTTAEPIGPILDVLIRTRLIASWGSCYRHPAIKRQRSAPQLCECGCGNWLPEAVLDMQERRSAKAFR